MIIGRAPIGVDIAASSVSVASDKMAFRALRNESVVGEGHAQALREMAPRESWRNRACRLSIPATDIHTHAVTLPAMRRGELSKVMAQDSFWRETMQLTTDRFMKHWSAMRARDGYRVAMFAVALSEVQVYMTCARRSGLNPRALVVVLPQQAQLNHSVLLWLDEKEPRLWSKDNAQISTYVLPRPPTQMTAADFEDIANRVAEDATAQIVCEDKRADEIATLRQYMHRRMRRPFRVLTPFEYFELRGEQDAKGDAFALARAAVARASLRSRNHASAHCVTFALASDSNIPRRVCIVAAAILPVMMGWFHWTLLGHIARVTEVEQTNRWLETTRQQLTSSIAGLRKKSLQRAEAMRRLESLNARHDVGTRVINAIGSLLPPHAHLSYFELNTEAKSGERLIELRGLAANIDSALMLVERLKAMPELGEVKLIEARSAKAERQGEKFHFTIECAARWEE